MVCIYVHICVHTHRLDKIDIVILGNIKLKKYLSRFVDIHILEKVLKKAFIFYFFFYLYFLFYGVLKKSDESDRW